MTKPNGFFDVRMRGFRDRADFEDARRRLLDAVAPLDAETVPARTAAGRVLAAPAVAVWSVPAFDRAAMDGYALRAEETFGADAYNPLELRVIGVSLPARPFAGVVGPGQAVRVMTGAPVPAGADSVLQAEAAEESAGVVRVVEAVPQLRHIGRIGEDVSAGRELLPAGRKLRPQDVGLLVSAGVAEVSVVRRPRVAILATGDELVPAGGVPDAFHIVDSNTPMLAALVTRDGGDAEAPLLIHDRHDVVRAVMHDAASRADIVLMSGGSSVGQEDHAPRVLSELGEILVHGVALRPASPAGFGRVGAAWVFLLPGNPVSCLCAYDLFAGVAVRVLGGRFSTMPYRTTRVPLSAKISSAVGRVDYVRVCLREGGAEPLAVSGASILSTTTRADGFVLVPAGCEGYAPGEAVEVWLYD